MKTSPIARAFLVFALVAAVGACQRDEYPGERKGAVERDRLPTPKKDTRVADATGEPTPIAAHPTAPKSDSAAAAAKALPSPKEVRPSEAPMVKEAPSVVAKAPAVAAAPPTPPAAAAVAPRSGAVAKGVDLREGPSADAEVLGTFQGRTKVQVIEEQGAYARVKAPTTGGASVEGWVLAAAVKAPEEKAPAAPKAAAESKPAGEIKSASSAAPKSDKPAAAAPKPAASAPKGGGGKGNGPDDISLKAIAGMTMKRAAVPFTHKKHYSDYSVKCEDCHHPVKAKGGAVPATKTCTDAGCHEATQCNGQNVAAKNKACPFFEDAYHFNCIECHRAQSGPTKCAECHSG